MTLKGRTGGPADGGPADKAGGARTCRAWSNEGKVSSKAEAARVLGANVNLVSQILWEAELEIPIRKAAPPSCRQVRSPSDKTSTMRDDGLCGRCRGAKVEVVCPSCGNTRLRHPSFVRVLKSDYCRRCWLDEISRRAAERSRATCSKCGRPRPVLPAEARRFKTGLCQSCYLHGTRQERVKRPSSRTRLSMTLWPDREPELVGCVLSPDCLRLRHVRSVGRLIFGAFRPAPFDSGSTPV